MALSDAFDNTAPATKTPSLASAFSNTAPAAESLPAVVVLADAGTAAADGNYHRTEQLADGKPIYRQSGTGTHRLEYDDAGPEWQVLTAADAVLYTSPDLPGTWTADTGDAPAPTATAAHFVK